MFVKRIYRPFQKGRTNAPIHVRSTGHHIFEVGEEYHIRKLRKYFLELFWGVKGEGVFLCRGKQWTLKPGEVCFYFPGDLHDITPVSPEWDYYWMGIDGKDIDAIIKSFHLRRTPVETEACPVELFAQLYELMSGSSIQNEYLAGACAFEILTRAVMGKRKNLSREVEAFLYLVSEQYSRHDFGVNEICEQLGVHRATIFRKIKNECGIAPSEYLISYRVQKGTELIQQKELGMEQIAKMTGFSSLNYFTKVVRRTLGVLPRDITSVYHSPILDKVGPKALRPPDISGRTGFKK